MENMLLNGYRFYRQHGRPAGSALAKARENVAAYHDAIAQGYGESKAARSHLRYPRDHGAAVCWQSEPKPHDAIGTWANPFPRKAERRAFVQDVDGAGLRHVGNVEADSHGGRNCWSRRDSCGWYSDNDQSATIYGVVYQLPGRGGMARFVAGYASASDCDGAPLLDFGTIYSEDMRGDRYNESAVDLDAARDAARAADSMAQSAAEDERQYQAAWQAGSRFAELAEAVADNRKAALALLAERRRAATAGKGEVFQAICGAIRDKVESCLELIAQARAEREKLKAGDFVSEWLPGFYTGEKRLQAAFNEGAGETILHA